MYRWPPKRSIAQSGDIGVTSTVGDMHDVAEFLKEHPPFSDLEETDLERLAAHAKVEFHAAGAVIFEEGHPPPDEARVIRRGAVELLERARVIDLLEEGDMFGQAWMFSGLETGWEARAREDTLCYALAAEDMIPLASGADGFRFVARSLLMLPRPRPPTEAASSGQAGTAQQPARALIRERPAICDEGTPLREAARRMVESGASSTLVKLSDGGLGIVTDHDLRSRVVARGLSLETPVRKVVTTPVVTARADEASTELMLAMLDHGIRHLPVVSARNEVLGVVTDLDLLALDSRTPFVLRRAISDAARADELSAAAARVDATVVDLYQGGLAPAQVSAIISVVIETLIRRAVELAVEAAGPPPAEFAYLALGSHGRREAVPSSDVDSGMAWRDDGGEAAAVYARAVADRVNAMLTASGLQQDEHGLSAAGQVVARPAGEWIETIGHWLAAPSGRSVMATAVMLDGRSIHGPEDALGVLAAVRAARDRPGEMRLLLRHALANKPPTGFLRNIVVEHSGEHRGTFDIKRGGLLPIVGIARYAGLAAGATSTSTAERLRASGEAGVLPASEATALEEAFRLMTSLRMEHQVRQLAAGTRPDNHLDPKGLNALTRRYLREAFRLVGTMQRRLSNELSWTA
jgi:CBS domain-containing protein